MPEGDRRDPTSVGGSWWRRAQKSGARLRRLAAAGQWKAITSSCKLEAQPRYRAKSEPVTVTPTDEGKLSLEFVRPQRAITPGQICAFYEGGTLLGGGVFEQVELK